MQEKKGCPLPLTDCGSIKVPNKCLWRYGAKYVTKRSLNAQIITNWVRQTQVLLSQHGLHFSMKQLPYGEQVRTLKRIGNIKQFQ